MSMDNILRTYIKNGTVFGPIDAGLIKTDQHGVIKELFDPQNKIYNALKSNPSLIIGRRGSGKTAYLHSIFIEDEYAIVQEIRTAKTFAQIVEAIEKNTPTTILAENISELWEQLFYFALFSEVARHHRADSVELRKLDDYLAKESLRGGNSVDVFLWNIVKAFSEKAGQSLTSAVADTIRRVTGIDFDRSQGSRDEHTYEAARKSDSSLGFIGAVSD